MSSSTLDEESFSLCCHLLLQSSDQLRDGWSWEALQGSEEGYLRKTVLRSVAAQSRSELSHQLDATCDRSGEAVEQQAGQCAAVPGATHEDARGHSEEENIEDGTCSVPESRSQLLHYEYHVLYSCSYNTPVLYFRVFTLEGKSLSLEEVWSSVHPSFRPHLLESPLDSITQQEHPLLGQPFFMLHPCRTREFMKQLLDHSRPVNYVLSWLSVVGPVVGLHIPLQYYTKAHPADGRPR